jgi:hypothetical protein
VIDVESQTLWTRSQNTTSRMHLEMAKALETAHIRRRSLLRSMGPKIASDQMAALVSEIMDDYL